MSLEADPETVDECIQLLVHEYQNNWNNYKRVFSNLTCPQIGRSEAIYAHKMHDVVVQILASKGVVIKNITRKTTYAVIKKLGMDPTRKEIVYLEEFLNHVRPHVQTYPFEKLGPFAGCPRPQTPTRSLNSKWDSSSGIAFSSGNSGDSSRNLRKKLSHIPVLQNHHSRAASRNSRPPSSSRIPGSGCPQVSVPRKPHSRSQERGQGRHSREGQHRERDSSVGRNRKHNSCREERSTDRHHVRHSNSQSNQHCPRPGHRTGHSGGHQSRCHSSRPLSSTGSSASKLLGSGCPKTRCDTPFASLASGGSISTSCVQSLSRPCSQNISTPVFNSFCDKSTTSLDQQTLCTSPCHIAQPSKKPEVSKDAQNSNTVETASQTLLTMEKFSTNHNHSSSSSKTRDRRKSPSPRLRKSSLDLGKSLSKTARTAKETNGGAGESLKDMFMKKFIPWKKNVGSANEEEVVPEKGDVASEKKEKKEEGDKGDVISNKKCEKCKHQK